LDADAVPDRARQRSLARLDRRHRDCTEAELLAEQLVRDLGGGQIIVYDAYLRLRTVKRLPA
jgi:hypothetical protein